jgi:hypothetical protein
MEQTPDKTRTPRLPDSMDLTAQTRSLRRKLVFWRRTAWLLLGGIGIFLAVLLNRGMTHQRECFQSLRHYAELAMKTKLGDQNPEILEQQWQSLEMGTVRISPIHYDLIVANWISRPKPGESQPLAICRDAHFSLMGTHRHVLYRDESGTRIEWMIDESTQHILQEALRDNHGK